MFGQKENVIILADYLALIDDLVERQRIRETLPYQAVGTKWLGEFILCGKRIRSTAIVTREQTIVGVGINS